MVNYSYFKPFLTLVSSRFNVVTGKQIVLFGQRQSSTLKTRAQLMSMLPARPKRVAERHVPA